MPGKSPFTVQLIPYAAPQGKPFACCGLIPEYRERLLLYGHF
jgi:hypothetical protein